MVWDRFRWERGRGWDGGEFFRAEIALLNPTRVVALGHDAYWLLKRYVPELLPILRRMWHFAYVVRYNKTILYEENARAALVA